MRRKRRAYSALMLLLLFLLVICLLWLLWEYRKEDSKELGAKIEQLQPKEDEDLWDALLQINPDIFAWLVIDDTDITCPVVHTTDNDYYLRRDIWENYSIAGTLFVDYRCEPDFSMFNTIIYGHNMSNGTMFADIVKFKQQDWFDSHKTGTLYTPDMRYEIKLFACLLQNMNAQAYDVYFYSPEEQKAHLNYIQSEAIHYRDFGVTEQDRFLTLSTCSYEFANARTILIARLIE